MQKILKNIFILSLLSVVFWSCKKDESNKVTYKGGEDITLSIITNTGGEVVNLSNDNALKKAIDIIWTNPNYQFSDGISSQDVTYELEIDTVGANFSNPDKKVISYSKDLGVSLDQKTFNGYVAFDPNEGLGLKVDQLHEVEMRVVATIRGVAITKYVSNVVKVKVTPYLDPSKKPIDLYITGSATPSGWTNTPPESQKFTLVGNKMYEIVMTFSPNEPVYSHEYKFLTDQGKWQPQYGTLTRGINGLTTENKWTPLGLNPGGGSDPAEVFTPNEAGTYKITVNLKVPEFKVEKM